MRKPDWDKALWAAIKAAEGRPFSWGSHDCCLFAADLVQAMTGTDHAAWFRRRRYRTKDGALRALAAFAGGGLLEAVRKIAAGQGWPEGGWKTARRGDLCLTMSDDGPSLAVCTGSMAAMAARDGGVVLVPMDRVQRAWRIG